MASHESILDSTAVFKRRSGVLKAQVIPAKKVDPATREAMWVLYAHYYEEGTRDIFLRDLAEKNHVIVIRDTGDYSVQGFSTIKCFSKQVDGRLFWVVYSGDTIVAKEHWGQTALQRAFLTYIIRTKLQHPFTPVYWFLISKGYKTYLLLSRNFPTYWPRHDKPMPAWEKKVLDTLAKEKFGDDYLPEHGIVHYKDCPGRLKLDVAPISKELQKKYDDIRFFVEKNPGHEQGDELCCLGLNNPHTWIHYLGKLGRKKAKKTLSRALGRRSGRLLTD